MGETKEQKEQMTKNAKIKRRNVGFVSLWPNE